MVKLVDRKIPMSNSKLVGRNIGWVMRSNPDYDLAIERYEAAERDYLLDKIDCIDLGVSVSRILKSLFLRYSEVLLKKGIPHTQTFNLFCAVHLMFQKVRDGFLEKVIGNYRELIRERLAELEHEQWIAWSKDIARTEKINPRRLDHWEKLWRPYSELTETEKNLDREWADKAMNILEVVGE